MRRDLDWLGWHSRGVAVVAHGQGGAVAHRALQRDVPDHLRLLFTFGSGLKKLEQLRYLLASGRSLQLSSILTIVMLPICAVGLAWFVWLPFTPHELRSHTWQGIPIMLFWTVVTGWLAWQGLRDHVAGIDPPELLRWLKRLQKLPLAWVDSYATADPVSNGALVDDDAAVRKCSEVVCNMSSVQRDHTTYWMNRDQFVTFLITKLADAELRRDLGLPPATDLASDRATLDYLAARRRWRVGIWTAIRWIGAAAVLVSVARAWPAWRDFFAYWGARFVGSAASLVGVQLAPPPPAAVQWGAFGYLLLAVVPLWIVRTIWRWWNKADMRQLIERRQATQELPWSAFVSTAIVFQVMIAVGVAVRAHAGVPHVRGGSIGSHCADHSA